MNLTDISYSVESPRRLLLLRRRGVEWLSRRRGLAPVRVRLRIRLRIRLRVRLLLALVLIGIVLLVHVYSSTRPDSFAFFFSETFQIRNVKGRWFEEGKELPGSHSTILEQNREFTKVDCLGTTSCFISGKRKSSWVQIMVFSGLFQSSEPL
jgi:hypothetical protein